MCATNSVCGGEKEGELLKSESSKSPTNNFKHSYKGFFAQIFGFNGAQSEPYAVLDNTVLYF